VQWELYTGKESAPEHLKSAFSNRDRQNETLFLAVHSSQQAFGRLLRETFSGSVTDYFDLVYVQQKDKIDIVRARYDVLNDVVQWEFRTRAGQLGLTFVETISKRAGAIVRLGFWTFTPLMEKYRPMFDQIAEETALLGEGTGAAQWDRPWLNLRKNLEGADIDYIALAKPSLEEAAAPDCAGERRSVLWQVKGTKNTVYLFGSIHLGRPDFYPLASQIESAFDHSGHLVVELDPTSDAFKKELAQFMAHARLPEGKTIRDVISPAVYRKLTESLERLGIPLDGIERIKPGMMAITLTAMKLQSMGYMPDFGADQYFLGRAKKGKEIVELEDFDGQMRLFESLGEERFLAYTLLSLNVMESKSGQLITAWRCGDLKTMQAILFEDLSSNMIDNVAEIYEKLFFSRNRQMADKIKTYLQKEGDYFVVVGAGHLVGDRSIVDLLRTEGYTVTGP
jgi:uncharacterized protein YbaP (TraB family)